MRPMVKLTVTEAKLKNFQSRLRAGIYQALILNLFQKAHEKPLKIFFQRLFVWSFFAETGKDGAG